MLRTTKNMKDKYEKIQNYLFALIPEKWEEIYLFASVVSGTRNMQNGELYFYYVPKGILKKRPVNVYEVPNRFNIGEEQYLNVVKDLYDCIKDLKKDFIDTEQELWTSLTISIANCRFRVEYNYGGLPMNEEESEQMRIIWRYKYLKMGGEKKDERKVLEEYFSKPNNTRTEVYETGLYMKSENTVVTFDKEDVVRQKEVVKYEKDDVEELKEIQDEEEEEEEEKNIESKFKKKKRQKDIDEDEFDKNSYDEEMLEIQARRKNQILNM